MSSSRLDSEPSSAVASADTTSPLNSNHPLQESPSLSKRRKDLFGDCALVEIIHLHDCLRGALKALERDVEALNKTLMRGDRHKVNELECRVNGRFKVIWSVFRAHSSAEDEFIWPALQSKTQGLVKGSPSYRPDHSNKHMAVAATPPPNGVVVVEDDDTLMDQEAYEEDHADEERMFSDMDNLLTQLREGLFQEPNDTVARVRESTACISKSSCGTQKSVDEIMKSIHELTQTLSGHLMTHLEKEEKQCMPLVVKHLSKTEIHDLVGQIMGKRSSDMISEIMTMAVQNLNQADRLEMVKYMKQAMAGTFFDKWLSMSGWMEDVKSNPVESEALEDSKRDASSSTNSEESSRDLKRAKLDLLPAVPDLSVPPAAAAAPIPSATDAAITDAAASNSESTVTAVRYSAGDVTSQTELEKLIRAIATNPTLTPKQKNTTIQGLRDSVWKSNHRLRSEAMLPSATPIARAYATRYVLEHIVVA